MKIFHAGSHQFRELLRELCRIAQVVRCHSGNGISYSENHAVSEFRELLREYPGTLLELRECPFHSESVFPEIGVVFRLLKIRNLDSPFARVRIGSQAGDSHKSPEGSRTETLSCESRLIGPVEITNRRFEAIRANPSNVMKIGGFLQIDPICKCWNTSSPQTANSIVTHFLSFFLEIFF